MPDFGGLIGSIGKFFEPNRPLRPNRKDRTRNLNLNIAEPKIVVSIRNAQNLPTRDNTTDEEVSKIHNLRDCCHVRFYVKNEFNFNLSLISKKYF